MELLAGIAVAVVALLHAGFLYLEMFLWQKPLGRKIFRLSESFAEESSRLAANQGLYNGFLAAGLIWGLASSRFDIQLFFLACVIIAGLFGAMTVGRNILFVQAAPAMVAIALLLFSQ